MPPTSLTVRDNAENLKKKLTYPTSPAFVNIYKMGRETELVDADEFCKKKNIPFNQEEFNYYRLKQGNQRFKQY